MEKQGRPVWDSSKSPEENASQKLPALARVYFGAGRALFAAQPTAGAFHKFRLETKRFRYTLELFESCYGPGLEERLKLLRTIQNVLGEINDCATTAKLLGEKSRISKFLERRMALKARALRTLWRQTFDGAGQETRWTNYLARFVRKPSFVRKPKGELHEDR
jgi:CHAD domain-containing protein